MYNVHIMAHVDVEWDEGKAQANLRKHGVDFADAYRALFDEYAITIEDGRAAETRYATIGLDKCGRLLRVIYTWRGSRVRLISARRATIGERRWYQEGR